MADREPSGPAMGLVLVAIGLIQLGLAVSVLDGALATFQMVCGALLVVLGFAIVVFLWRRGRRA